MGLRFILHSEIAWDLLATLEGRNDRSLLRTFRAFLAEIGTVRVTLQPETEVDAAFRECEAAGELCLFLPFSTPDRINHTLACPTVPVFGWRYGAIPKAWWPDFTGEETWPSIFTRYRRMLTLSRSAEKLVRAASPATTEVVSLPPPIFERYASLRASLPTRGDRKGAERVRGVKLDTRTLHLSADNLLPLASPPPPPDPQESPSPAARAGFQVRLAVHGAFQWYRARLRSRLPTPLARAMTTTAARIRRAPPHTALPAPKVEGAQLDGVVYVSLVDLNDPHCAWTDVVTAFCYAFREQADAILVLAIDADEPPPYLEELHRLLTRLSPFRCRVVAAQGRLDEPAYDVLLRAADYYAHASLGDELALPPLEFMCCGVPVIAAAHTSMAEHLDAGVGFPVESSLEHCFWPPSPPRFEDAFRHRLGWQSLHDALRRSHALACDEPEAYARLSEACIARTSFTCSAERARKVLLDLLGVEEAVSRDLREPAVEARTQ